MVHPYRKAVRSCEYGKGFLLSKLLPMALRDQPYIPLYVQDIMTDEKLNECSAATHGIYIKGIMCLMHKSEHYGKLLLKQKYKQIESIPLSFAKQYAKHTPYTIEEFAAAIQELIEEEVCYLESDFICQKRMITDNELSLKRAKAGSKGGKVAQAKSKATVKAKRQATPEIEIENENINKGVLKFKTAKDLADQLIKLHKGYFDIVCINNQIPKAKLTEIVTDFCSLLMDKGETWKAEQPESMSEFKKHFANWLRLNKPRFEEVKKAVYKKGDNNLNDLYD